jgi:hypothetical protein
MTSLANNGALKVTTKDGVKFGKELREKEFLFDKAYLPLNHGMLVLCSISWSPFASFKVVPSVNLSSVYHISSYLSSLMITRSRSTASMVRFRCCGLESIQYLHI